MSSFSKEGNVQTEENNVLPDPSLKNAPLQLTSKHLSSAQQADETWNCFNCVVSADQASKEQQACFVEQDILMRQWSPQVRKVQTGVKLNR